MFSPSKNQDPGGQRRPQWLTFSTISIQIRFGGWHKDGFASWKNSHFAKTIGRISSIRLPCLAGKWYYSKSYSISTNVQPKSSGTISVLNIASCYPSLCSALLQYPIPVSRNSENVLSFYISQCSSRNEKWSHVLFKPRSYFLFCIQKSSNGVPRSTQIMTLRDTRHLSKR